MLLEKVHLVLQQQRVKQIGRHLIQQHLQTHNLVKVVLVVKTLEMDHLDITDLVDITLINKSGMVVNMEAVALVVVHNNLQLVDVAHLEL